jgi:hypothetical protein
LFLIVSVFIPAVNLGGAGEPSAPLLAGIASSCDADQSYRPPSGSAKTVLRISFTDASGKVIAAIVAGCLDGAGRREAISEVMRLHRRVLLTPRPALIASPEDQAARPKARPSVH